MSVVFAQDSLRRDFDPIRRFISELAIGPLGWIQILNFLVSAALIVVFARSLAAQFSESRPARRGALLLTIAGASMFLSGMFVADPMSLDTVPTWHGIVHTAFGLVVFILIPVSCGYFLRHFRVDERWASLRFWTLLTILAGVGFWIVLFSLSFVPELLDLIGLVNRFVVGIWLLWLFLLAFKVQKQGAIAT